MDWLSRYVLSWSLSNTLDAAFCLEALDRALRIGQPEIFNSDQGVNSLLRSTTPRVFRHFHSSVLASIDVDRSSFQGSKSSCGRILHCGYDFLDAALEVPLQVMLPQPYHRPSHVFQHPVVSLVTFPVLGDLFLPKIRHVVLP